jgi:purine-binding chemotaxis protein CheW
MSVSSITDLKQYLAFNLGDESFALDVVNVREILEFTTLTKIPGTPDFMRGVINLRGSVVPVMDMRSKFHQEVFELEPDQIEPVPRIGTQLKTEFIKGMGRRDDRFIIILDIDRVFSTEAHAIQDTEMARQMMMAGNQ